MAPKALAEALGKQDPRRRLNAVCPYYTMFPLDFPLRVLAPADDKWVLDPFCGRGTTLYAARLLGLPAVGIDANPVAAALAQSKLVEIGPDAVIRRCRQLLDSGYEPADVPEGEFWERCFAPPTLRQIASLREQLLVSTATPVTVMLRALVLGVLHGPLRVNKPSYLSNQMPRTYASKPGYAVRYWKAEKLIPPPVDVLDVIERRARYTLAEVPEPVAGRVWCGDVRSELARVRQRFSWVVTSPPYYGMRTYLPDQWLRSWFLGADPVVDYSISGQLSQSSETAFVTELAAVWTAVASRCEDGARLVVRFGALPSRSKDPAALLARSLEAAESSWSVDEVVDAGVPPRGKRQADQMRNEAGDYVEEVDLYATLAS